ncbi:MAG: hypothetical protein R3Y32_02065 [Bacillota bacterium]
MKTKLKSNKLISLIVVLALLLSLFSGVSLTSSTLAFAEEVSCDCSGCTTDHSDWTEITTVGGELTAGYYYLSDNVNLTNNITITSGEVTICLNGKTLTGNGSDSVITVSNGATLNLYDSSAGTGSITGGGASYGGGIYSKGVVNMYGGNITGNTSTNGGSGVYVSAWLSNNECASGVEYNMYGGTITNNTTISQSASGGGVYVIYEATFNMYGGTISGHKAPWGGGIAVDNDAVFNMSGGTISDNESTYYGGGVCIYDATFDFTGGEISGNTSGNGGGGIAFLKTSTLYSGYEFTMSGGKVTGNTAVSGGGIAVLTDSGLSSEYYAEFIMTGGEVSSNIGTSSYADVYVSDNSTVEIYGGTFTSEPSSYIATGYTATYNDDTAKYTVSVDVDSAVAQVGDSYYTSLQSAIDAADEGDTVYILKDIDLNVSLGVNVDESLSFVGIADAEGDLPKISNSYINSTNDSTWGLFNIGTNATESLTVSFDSIAFYVNNQGIRLKDTAVHNLSVTNCEAYAVGVYCATDEESPFYSTDTNDVYDNGIDCDNEIGAENFIHFGGSYTGGNLIFENNVINGHFRNAIHSELAVGSVVVISDNEFLGSNPEETIAGGMKGSTAMVLYSSGTVSLKIENNDIKDYYRGLTSCHGVGLPNLTLINNVFIDVSYPLALSTNGSSYGFNLGYNYYEYSKVASTAKIWDHDETGSNSRVEGVDEYIYVDNSEAYIFYPYYADSDLTTLVYDEDGTSSTVEDAVAGLTDVDVEDADEVSAAIDLITAADSETLASDSGVVDMINTIEAAIVDDNDDLDIVSTIDTLTNSEDIEASYAVVTGSVDVSGLAVSYFGNSASVADATIGLEVVQTAGTEETLEFTITPYVLTDDGVTKKTIANEELNAPITIALTLPDSYTYDYVTIKHTSTDGDETTYDNIPVVDKTVTFTVTHFSTFEIIEYVAPTSSSSSNITLSSSYTVGGTSSSSTSTEEETTEPEATEAPVVTEAPTATETPTATIAPVVPETTQADSSSNAWIWIVLGVLVVGGVVGYVIYKKKKQ